MTTETAIDKQTTDDGQAPSFAQQVEEILEGIEGTVGVFAKDLGSGRELAYNPREVFPTASTLKVPLLYELYRQADAGKIDLTQRITIEAKDRVPGSGVLQDLDPGLAPTVRDLAELMIVVSDNFATDLLMGFVGKEKIAAMLTEQGLRQTSIPLTIREMFCAIAGLDPSDPAATYDGLKAALKDTARGQEGLAYSTDPANDVSSPADMVHLLELIERGEGLTTGSREAIIEMLKHQKFNTIIPFRLPDGTDVAHKTGSIKGVRNDVGLVYAPSGPYAVAIMSRGLDDVTEAVGRLARLSLLVWDELTGEQR